MMPKATLWKQLFLKIEIKLICLTECVLWFLTEWSFSQAKKDMLKTIITIMFLFMIKKATKESS